MNPSRRIPAILSVLVLALLRCPSQSEPGPPVKLSDRFCLVHGTPEIMIDLGTRWNRFDFSWSGIEREKGVFDFRDLPGQIDHSLGLDVQILPILDYEPAWDPDHSPADEKTLALWERYVEKTVDRFNDQLPYWQVWNEPNIAFWKPTPNARDYAELLRRSYSAIKRVDPGLKVLGVNASDIDLDFTEKVFRYGGLDHCDIVAYQPYRIAPEVGHFEEVAGVRALMREYGGEKPIWFTELGWNSDHYPFVDAKDYFADRPARRQAAFLVRYMVLTQVSRIEKAFWFAEGAGGHGLIDRKDNRKRPAYTAYQHLIRLLDDWTVVQEVVPGGAFGVYAYLFQTPGPDVLVAWCSLGERELNLPGMEAAREVRDMLGEPAARIEGDRVKLSAEPVYFLFDEAPQSLLEMSTRTIRPGVLFLEPGGSGQIYVDRSATRDLSSLSLSGLPPRVRWERSPDGFRITARIDARFGRYPLTVSDGKSRWVVEFNITPRQAWDHKKDAHGVLSPRLLSRGDDPPLLLVGAYDSGNLACLDAEGSEQWVYEESAPIHSAPVVANIRGDTDPEIVFAIPSKETVVALSHKGVLLWRTRLCDSTPVQKPEWDWKGPAVSDLDGDGLGEILYADSTGSIHALSGAGAVLWTRQLGSHSFDVSLTPVDVGGGGSKNFLAGDSAGNLFCLNSAGETIWAASLGSAITAPPVAVESAVLVVTANEQLRALGSKGEPLWSSPLGGTADLGCGIVSADLDGDGLSEVVVSTRNHAVLAFDAQGDLLWRTETGAQLRSRPMVEDIDKDGQLEILIGSADSHLYCIGPDGGIEWRAEVGNRVDATPAIMPINSGAQRLVLPIRGGRVVAWEIP